MEWNRVMEQVKTLHFLWFAANVVTVVVGLLAFVSVIMPLPLYLDPYKTACKACILSFGIVLYKKHPVRDYLKSHFSCWLTCLQDFTQVRTFVAQVAQEEETLYLLLAVYLLFASFYGALLY